MKKNMKHIDKNKEHPVSEYWRRFWYAKYQKKEVSVIEKFKNFFRRK